MPRMWVASQYLDHELVNVSMAAWASLSLLFFVGLPHVVVSESLVELQADLLQRHHHQSPLLDLVNSNSVPDNLDHANL